MAAMGTAVPRRVTSVLEPDLGLTALETPFFSVLRANMVLEMESPTTVPTLRGSSI